MTDPLHPPIDPVSAEALAARGLRMGLVDPADDAQLRPWLEADHRGFLDPAMTDEAYELGRDEWRERRLTGVWDEALDHPEVPVATSASWAAELTVPGPHPVPAWAVSSVTVAPTHRRRGVARAILEAELRNAVDAGCPVAVLTVSESTIYGRFGFGPAADAAHLTVDTRRLVWTAPDVPGRLQYVARDAVLGTAQDVYDRMQRRTPGAVALHGGLIERLFGQPSDPRDVAKHRIVRYDDADGVPQGVLSYIPTENLADFAASTVQVRTLLAATVDAAAALWRFLVELDLIVELDAGLRPVDDPLRWQVSDPRSVRVTSVRDHLWVRVLDPVAALGARRYGAAGRLVLGVADAQGYASGTWVVETDADGAATVTRADGADVDVALEVRALGPLLLGGVSASALAAAGLLTERRPGALATVDALFRTARAPWLGIWF